jgi:hypothetical protein
LKLKPQITLDEWHKYPFNEGIPPEILEQIGRHRRQMLIHSYIYYTLDDNVWNDHKWQEVAFLLAELQKEWGWNVGFYDDIFQYWTGQSGYWLPTNKPGYDRNVERVAQRVLDSFKASAI